MLRFFCIIFIWSVYVAILISANTEASKFYTTSWAVQLQSTANDDDVHFIAASLGLKYKRILPNNYFLLIDEHNQDLVDKPKLEITEAIRSYPKVIWVAQQAAEQFESRNSFQDPLWSKQNQLVSHRVEDVWAQGYTGKDVTVVVIDDGVRGTHEELTKRYDNVVSVDIAQGSSPSSGHGSHCAGVIAAEANNNLCGVGAAYDCNIAGIRLFAGKTATDAEEAQAFYRDAINPSKADIFSNSWGPSDNGWTTRGPGRLAAEALKHGVEKGRNGLGNIYVFSCGNGAGSQDSCAFDGYANSIYTISVASISKDGKITGFSEPCGAVMTAATSTNMVTISHTSDTGCVSDFGRTSAAAAFVSGILALALEANKNLSWRDMQHLIARSSTWKDVDPAVKRITNAKNFTVNENFGFGVLDALTLTNNAKNWNITVPDQVMCTLDVTPKLGLQPIPSRFNVEISKTNLNCGSGMITSLEHIQIQVGLNHTNRAILAIDVESHSGTASRFVYPRRFDSIDSPKTYKGLVMTSVHFWGESLLGTWTVDIKETVVDNNDETGILFNMVFVFYGTAEDIKDNVNNVGVDNSNTNNGNNKKNGGDQQNDDVSKWGVGKIVGLCVGVATFLVLVVVAICMLKCRPKNTGRRGVVKGGQEEVPSQINMAMDGRNVRSFMV